jgi:ribose transport system ATP-binding protein
MIENRDIPLLRVRGITRRFPGVTALDGVDLDVRRGEVLALIGENGAGKSTLMKILAGIQTLDEGEIRIDGQRVAIDSCRRAIQLGIALIHQELNLADNLSVAANIGLGREPHRLGFVNRRTLHAEASDVLGRIGLDVDPDTLVRDLSIGQQQLVEIAKALSADARLLIMDEPTSSLSAGEAERLFEVVHDLRRRGVSVVYISHRLGEVKRLADRVEVLRDGRNAGSLEGAEIGHEAMVTLMVGREMSRFYAHSPHPPGDTVLEVDRLVTAAWPRQSISFSVRAGEIVGVAGLVGAGRTELARVLFGVDRPLSGTLRWLGQPVAFRMPRDAIEAGLALVPEERKEQGLIVEMNVRQNVSLAGLWRHRRRLGGLNRDREAADALTMVERLGIKTPHLGQTVRFLSGGNQQKVVLGKWLTMGPRLLLLDEPTRGIDVGAKEEVYRLMEDLAHEGLAVLFISSELEEILGMSDRVLVLHEGRLAGELPREALTEEAVMHLATGATSRTGGTS